MGKKKEMPFFNGPQPQLYISFSHTPFFKLVNRYINIVPLNPTAGGKKKERANENFVSTRGKKVYTCYPILNFGALVGSVATLHKYMIYPTFTSGPF